MASSSCFAIEISGDWRYRHSVAPRSLYSKKYALISYKKNLQTTLLVCNNSIHANMRIDRNKYMSKHMLPTYKKQSTIDCNVITKLHELLSDTISRDDLRKGKNHCHNFWALYKMRHVKVQKKELVVYILLFYSVQTVYYTSKREVQLVVRIMNFNWKIHDFRERKAK